VPAVNIRHNSENLLFASRDYLNFVEDHRCESADDSSVSLLAIGYVRYIAAVRKQLQSRTAGLVRAQRSWCHEVAFWFIRNVEKADHLPTYEHLVACNSVCLFFAPP
jgi:hypothetical protein